MPKFFTVDKSGNAKSQKTFELVTDYTQYDIWNVENLYSKADAISRIKHLYSEGLSEHGIQYLIRQGIVIFKEGTRIPLQITHTIPMIEAIFELVRRSEFPEKPSRMQSMFAWVNLEDARQFEKKIQYRMHDLRSGNEQCIYCRSKLIVFRGLRHRCL